MPLTIYGIKNCDTMKKARAWLDQRGVTYAFHDYKAAAIVGYLDAARMLIGWCELRKDFRSFRVDRISRATFLEERFPARPVVLRAKWLATLPKPPDRSCEETSVAMNAANSSKKQKR